ncbi:nucleotidyl transferase AbiEii/AbiGii toxin family protein [Streptomyces sp. URMC 123]|uniref:nucleotidyl transferase AbiEii/AbiGii toxin family protein n=1 Tax=Streptomyces sp. URMC 123 TaxID=3423403 RepID=UPI003F1CD8F3
MPDLHRRLLADAIDLGHRYGLALTGGYAVRALGVLARPSRDLNLATEDPAALSEIAGHLSAGLEARGWRVTTEAVGPLVARLTATDGMTGDACGLTLHKEVLWRPPVHTELGPALALEDLMGTKVRALADRGLPADVVDVFAARQTLPPAELELLGARHDEDFDLSDLHDRLEALEWVGDGEFLAYGLTEDEIAELRAWAVAWQQDIGERLAEPYDEPEATDP